MRFRSTFTRHRTRHGIRHTAARAWRRFRPCVANGRLRHVLIGYARVSKPPGAALYHRRASDDVVISTIRSDCSRLERPLPGGIRTH